MLSVKGPLDIVADTIALAKRIKAMGRFELVHDKLLNEGGGEQGAWCVASAKRFEFI